MAERALKILFLGAMAVGKSSLIRRYVSGSFSADYKSTLGVQLHEVVIPVPNGARRAVLWDTDGDAGASIVSSPFARGADAALIVCDVQRLSTVDIALELAEAMQDILPGRPYVAAINKVDLGRPSEALRARLADECDTIVETSAADGTGIGEALATLVQHVAARGEG